ncbi:MAG TPA: MoaD/ThiS family protein [Sphingomicrobium sp.]|jgi:molybdopterin synthase sulfur carrier subunit|nr:MoaD/ThiS family protein [Sphingomicrobium sp.]
MRLLSFGKLSHLALEGVDIPAGVTDSDALRRFLGERWPELNSPGVQLAVNHTLVRGSVPISPGDEIAFLPPMSGG